PKDALDDEREAERQQQSIKMIEVLQALEEQALDDHADDADNDRRNDDRPPVAEPQVLQQEKRGEGAQHVLGAVGKVDHVQHPEDHREPETEQGVERAVDKSEQQLPEQSLRRNAKNLEHEVFARLTGATLSPGFGERAHAARAIDAVLAPLTTRSPADSRRP